MLCKDTNHALAFGLEITNGGKKIKSDLDSAIQGLVEVDRSCICSVNLRNHDCKIGEDSTMGRKIPIIVALPFL